MPENNNTYDMPFPQRLRLLLDETGISQQELADFVGVKRQTIAQWKDGKTVPDIHNFQKVAQYFSVPYEYLLGDTESRVRDNFHLERVLGLSDGAIESLMRLHGEEAVERVPLSVLVSYIVQDESFSTSITHFQSFLRESVLFLLRQYNSKYREKIADELNAATVLLQNAGIAVMDADAMKSYHLERAKAAFGQAMEAVEEKIRADNIQRIEAFFKDHDADDFTEMMNDMLRKEVAKWQQP